MRLLLDKYSASIFGRGAREYTFIVQRSYSVLAAIPIIKTTFSN